MSWLQWIAENWFVIVIVALFLLGIVIAITNTQQASTQQANTQQASNTSNKQKTTYYAIQILASQKPLEANAPQFKGYKCQYIRAGGYYKYYTAENTDRTKVEEKLQQVKKSFPDCWIITFQK